MKRARRRTQPRTEQPPLFEADDGDSDLREADYELERDIHRMTLETSSNVYAQRRSQW